MGIVPEGDRGLLESQEFLLKGPQIDLLRFTPSEFQHLGATQKAPVTPEEELKCLASGQELQGQLSQTDVLAEAIVPFRALSPQSWQVGTIFESP